MNELHPRLAADTHRLGELPEGTLLLHRNASLPWLILVPPGGASQLHELPADLRARVHERLDCLSRLVLEHFGSSRVNVAAIGNLVPQLHVHVVGRRPDDPAWPGVVWGADLPPSEWDEPAIAALRARLGPALRGE